MPIAKTIAQDISEHGGRAYYVGGMFGIWSCVENRKILILKSMG